jgi:hypothetical protein
MAKPFDAAAQFSRFERHNPLQREQRFATIDRTTGRGPISTKIAHGKS